MFGADPISEPEISVPTLDCVTDLVKGLRVEDDMLIIDAHFEGITFEQLKNSLNVTATENAVVTFSLVNTFNASEYVGTGARLTIKAENDIYSTSVEYDDVILGDVDGDGLLRNNDIIFTRQFWVGTKNLTLIQQRASDMNDNDRIEAGDATLMGRKYVDWNSYDSTLN